MSFDSLRTTPWSPTFTWVNTLEDAADRINSFHEDYPTRVRRTASVISRGLTLAVYPDLLSIHREIFYADSHGGKFRQVNVRVGLHRPPDWELVPKLMDQLMQTYVEPFTLATLNAWYSD